MEQTAGKQSISFTEPVHIISSASVVGPKEGEGPLGDGFDLIAPEADFCVVKGTGESLKYIDMLRKNSLNRRETYI